MRDSELRVTRFPWKESKSGSWRFEKSLDKDISIYIYLGTPGVTFLRRFVKLSKFTSFSRIYVV